MYSISKKIRNTIRIILVGSISICGLFVLMIVGMEILSRLYPPLYETTDIAEYGNYEGVLERAQNWYIDPLFPDEIQDDFSDVTFSFRSYNIDVWGFEAYLEFTIEDQAAFDAYLADAVKMMESQPFFFDTDYQEYVLRSEIDHNLYDDISLRDELCDDFAEHQYHIESASIVKMLVNPEEHRFIYVSLCVHSGGASYTKLFDTYFERFGIDPIEYEAYTKSRYPRN